MLDGVSVDVSVVFSPLGVWEELSLFSTGVEVCEVEVEVEELS